MQLLGQEKPKPLPAVTVSYDPETQAVGLQLHTAVVKNWSFGKALLTIAADLADEQHKIQRMNEMQQQAMAAHEIEAVRKAVTKH